MPRYNKGNLILLLLASCFSSLRSFTATPSLAAHCRRYFSLDVSRQHDDDNHDASDDTSRRRLLNTVVTFTASSLFLVPQTSLAASSSTTTTDFVRQQKDFGYKLELPDSDSWSPPSNKPLKTHLDEVNFSNKEKTITIGITVDPVRISSLQEFGTPEQVAARVVTAEVNRDGVFEVTLLQDPMELLDSSYLLQYLSQGKRGNKRNVCKIFIQNNKLYVLTAQVKEDAYTKDMEKSIQAIVDSFTII